MAPSVIRESACGLRGQCKPGVTVYIDFSRKPIIIRPLILSTDAIPLIANAVILRESLDPTGAGPWQFFTSSSPFTTRVISFKYLRLLIFLPAILIHACASSSLAFSRLYTIYELWVDVCDIVQGTGSKTIPKKKKSQKAKWLSEKTLQRTVQRREAKSKGEKEIFIYFNAEFQRIARRDKKAFLSN